MSKEMMPWTDIESGQLVWITKESYDLLMRQRQEFHERLSKMLTKEGKIGATIIITSTMADNNDKMDDMRNIWNEFKSHNI